MASTTRASRTIHASPAAVFDTIAHIENFSSAIPDITNVEFLTEQRRGEGTRFRETRKMGKREASTILEVTEYVPEQRVRLVSDAGGTNWDSTFTVTPEGDRATRLDFEMESRPYKLLARLFVPLIRGMVAKAIEKDLDAVKAHCEGADGDSA